jgi:hypothetical protein
MAAALSQDGKCITTSSAKSSQSGQENAGCSKDDLHVSVLLYAGATPSPEVQLHNLQEGHPSLAMISILHWSTAKALGLQSDMVSISDARIRSSMEHVNSSSLEERPGTIFFDVAFSVCASTSERSVAGGVFERGFIQSWQDFAAFPVTSVRVLELEIVGASEESPNLPPSQPSPHSSGRTHQTGQSDNQPGQDIWDEFKDMFWLWPVAGLACILLCVASCRLLHMKCCKQDRDSQKPWRDVAPTAHLQKDHFEARVIFESTTGTMASVAYDFDPNSDSGKKFASSGGLESTECLTVAKEDLLEIFARGEGWLYGRRSYDGSFGYLPESFVSYQGTVVMNHSTDKAQFPGTDVQEVVIAQIV